MGLVLLVLANTLLFWATALENFSFQQSISKPFVQLLFVMGSLVLVFFFCLQVNHLSKRHPDMKIEEVPELTLPIIKPNRDYFCQYCDKVKGNYLQQDASVGVLLRVNLSAHKNIYQDLAVTLNRRFLVFQQFSIQPRKSQKASLILSHFIFLRIS